jgi:hypothetical protein
MKTFIGSNLYMLYKSYSIYYLSYIYTRQTLFIYIWLLVIVN